MKSKFKLLITLAVVGVIFISLVAGAAYTIAPGKGNVYHIVKLPEGDHSPATVTQQQGLFIFILCTPQDQFETLGTVKVGGVVMSAQPEDLLNTLLKKAAKQYSTAEGIVIHDLKFESCDVIKFK